MINEFFVYLNSPASSKAQDFAEKHHCKLIEKLSLTDSQAAFEFVGEYLRLHVILDNQLTHIQFDLDKGKFATRANQATQSNEIVAKAIGCKPGYRPKILDITAGMGRDALIMAKLGCQVVMQERNFAIYHLLKNALKRLQQNEQFLTIAKNLTLVHCDSLSTKSKSEVDVIYCDPMFPIRKKSALVKKEMRIFHRLCGDDIDSDQLLVQSLNSNAKRIVVKRPKGAEFLANLKPSHQVLGKQFRYDVYSH